MTDKRVAATLEFLKTNTIQDLKENSVFFYNNEHINISDFQREVQHQFSTASTMEKINIKEKYNMFPYEFLTLNLHADSTPKPKKKKKSPTFQKEKSNKTKVIPAFRVEEPLHNLYIKKIKKLQIKNPRFNNTSYMTELLTSDLKKGDVDTLELIQREELIKELRFLSLQTSKIGNNINQISHGINSIKKKKNRFLTSEDRANLIKYHNDLEILSERYTLITKKIQKIKI